MVETIQTKKALGQHFLKDRHLCERIADFAGLDREDTVIEIGAGAGHLTQSLLNRVAKVIAIEFDQQMIEFLRTRKVHWAHCYKAELQLVQRDILELDWNSILEGPPVKVVGNLPYNISTRLLRKMTERPDSFHSLTFMVQKEVAERILAGPGCKDYGYLTLLIQFHFHVMAGFDVSPGAFQPPPKVMSHVLRLVPIRPPRQVKDYPRFVRLIQQAFLQRRKTLRTNLRRENHSEADLEAALMKCGIGRMARAEEVSLQQFLCLAAVLS